MPDQPTHELVLRGRFGHHLLGPFMDDFAVRVDEPGRTCLVGSLRDASHLHGLLAHLASINAELISISPVATTTHPRSTS